MCEVWVSGLYNNIFFYLVCPDKQNDVGCGMCIPEYFGDPFNGICEECNCNVNGSMDSNCDQMGKCECFSTFYGFKCDLG